MTEKHYATNVSIILGIGVMLMLFIFVLVAHHRSIPERVRQDRSELLDTGSSVAERIKPVGQVNVASAETQREPEKNAVAAPPPSRDGQQVYQTTCVACHGAGIAGAPKLGEAHRQGPRHSLRQRRQWGTGERGSDAAQRREPGAEQRRGQGRRRLHGGAVEMSGRNHKTPEVSSIAGWDTLFRRSTLAAVVVAYPAVCRFLFADLEGDG
jgi:cytochrome c553